MFTELYTKRTQSQTDKHFSEVKLSGLKSCFLREQYLNNHPL